VRHVGNFVVKDTNFNNSPTALELIETTALIVNSTFASNRKGLYCNRERAILFHPEYGCLFHGFIGGAIITTNSKVDTSHNAIG
jgi:hypothetical protein